MDLISEAIRDVEQTSILWDLLTSCRSYDYPSASEGHPSASEGHPSAGEVRI